MLPQTSDPIIDLTTPRTRTVVKMDSGTYRFRSPFDLTIAETTRIERAMPRFLELALRGHDRTARDGDELGTLAVEICTIGLLEGDPTHAGPSGCVVLADFFFELCLQNIVRLGQVRETFVAAPLKAGTRPSPVSSASTAAPRTRGSRKQRSGPSRRS